MRASEQNPQARREWIEQARAWNIDKLVFLDECGINTTLHRRYARAPRGVRAVGVVPRNWKHNTTVVGALSLSGVVTAMTLEGALDQAAFEVFIEAFLCPKLKPGQIVIADNLSAHNSARVKQLIQEKKCHWVFLLTYSPDLNPLPKGRPDALEPVQERAAQTRRAHPRGARRPCVAGLVPCHTQAHPKLVPTRGILLNRYN